ncbi:MAG: hypothetical protein WBD27_01960 [Pyrinomonadaceae bacterium]
MEELLRILSWVYELSRALVNFLLTLFEPAGPNLQVILTFVVLIFGNGLLILILKFGWKTSGKLFRMWRREQLNRDLAPYFSEQDVLLNTEYFIPTKYQDVSPSEDDEPVRKYIETRKAELLPLFLETIFRYPRFNNKYYLILADTGMGKTTFMMNLFTKYKNSWLHYNPFSYKYEIALIPLGHENALDAIRSIQNKNNTLLLLDALDEDPAAIINYKERLDLILTAVSDFRTIVLTCRTQFFESEVAEPSFAKSFSFGESGEYRFQKQYISVFSDREVKLYLRRKYSRLSSRYWKARSIVEKCPSLVVRPLLLSRIDDLLDTDQAYDYTFQVYEALIQKWIERESIKPHIRTRYGSKEIYQEYLYELSRALALDMYENRLERKGFYVFSHGTTLPTAIQLADLEAEFNADASKSDARSRSLLTRNAQGEYKFAHKSFLEYFLAKEMLDNNVFLNEFDFAGMDAARRFLEEMADERPGPKPISYVYYDGDLIGEDKNTIGSRDFLPILQF